MAATTKERFDAAVEVIHTLPKNGENVSEMLCILLYIKKIMKWNHAGGRSVSDVTALWQ